MKQHITLEQVLEVGYEKCVRLIIDSSKQDRFIREYEFSDSKSQWEEHISEQFTIGKMIEILINLDYKPLIDTFALSCDVSIYKDDLYKGFDSLELCDALWECFKYVINA